MQKVLLDTNFLLIPGQYNVDIFSQLRQLGFELFITAAVLEELQQLSSGRSRDAAAAKLALQLIKAQKINTLPKHPVTEAFKKADDELVSLAGRGYAVATQDRELRRLLLRQGSAVIVLRQKKIVSLIP